MERDKWRVLVTSQPATPGAHTVLVMSKTGEVEKYLIGR